MRPTVRSSSGCNTTLTAMMRRSSLKSGHQRPSRKTMMRSIWLKYNTRRNSLKNSKRNSLSLRKLFSHILQFNHPLPKTLRKKLVIPQMHLILKIQYSLLAMCLPIWPSKQPVMVSLLINTCVSRAIKARKRSSK